MFESSQHICHQVRLFGVDHRRKIITMPPIVILTDRAIYRLCLIMQLADSFESFVNECKFHPSSVLYM